MSFKKDLNTILKKYKKKKALVDIYSGREVTYQELSIRIKKIKKFLILNKIKKEDEVGSVLENSCENFEFFLASCKMGLKYFPQSCEITKYEIKKLLNETNIKSFFISDTTNSKIVNYLKKKKN